METTFTIRENLPEIQLEKLIFTLTGNIYCFATSSVRKWGNEDAKIENLQEGFFQLMPDKTDNGFFDWYCSERPYHQFFSTKENAALNFLHYWTQWKAIDK